MLFETIVSFGQRGLNKLNFIDLIDYVIFEFQFILTRIVLSRYYRPYKNEKLLILQYFLKHIPIGTEVPILNTSVNC